MGRFVFDDNFPIGFSVNESLFLNKTNKKKASHKVHQGTKNGALLPNSQSQLLFSDKK
jgi:hypothetical protein